MTYRPEPSILIDGEALTADEAAARLNAPQAPAYGRSYHPKYQARLKRSLARILAVDLPEREAADVPDPPEIERDFPPAYIEAECKEIRKTWSPRERKKRMGCHGRVFGELEIPTVRVTEAFVR